MTLILKEKEKWDSSSEAGCDVYTFEQDKKKFTITWWTSFKTFVMQGDDKYCSKINRKIQQLLKQSVANTAKNVTPKRKRRKGKQSQNCETISENTKDDSVKELVHAEIQKV